MQCFATVFKVPSLSITIDLLFTPLLGLPLIGQMCFAHQLAFDLEYRIQVGAMSPFQGSVEQPLSVANRWWQCG
ncbi:hypothetical protein C7A17_11185 [Ectopseudomonas mendocina]|uniref:Uncharacterized protein n=1 Tax=Ectopseudomonas mendocina TaxID=300 RepID=A0A2R3QNE8_ECTME|nr:hypothetical protein C7A17_11185 [Pseudomonas mendocina]